MTRTSQKTAEKQGARTAPEGRRTRSRQTGERSNGAGLALQAILAGGRAEQLSPGLLAQLAGAVGNSAMEALILGRPEDPEGPGHPVFGSGGTPPGRAAAQELDTVSPPAGFGGDAE